MKKIGYFIFFAFISLLMTINVYATNGFQSANVTISQPTSGSFYTTGSSVVLKYTVYDAYPDTYVGNDKITSATYIEVYKWNGSSWTSVGSYLKGVVENGSYSTNFCDLPGCPNGWDLTKFPISNTSTKNLLNGTGTYKINVVNKPYNLTKDQFVPTSVIPESNYAMKTVYVNVYSTNYRISYSSSSGTKYVGDTFTPTLNNNVNGLAVTYSSSNSNVASVDSKGKITVKAVGTATITAKLSYSSSTVSTTYKVTAKKGDPYAKFASTSISKKATDGTFTNKLTYSGDGKVTYSSSNTSVATVSTTGVVTIKGSGTATIKASIAATTNWESDSASYTLTVSKVAGGAKFASSTVAKKTNDAAFTNKLTITGDGKATYKSSNTNVATVDANGKVTIKGAGTTTITATVAATAKYNASSASYTLTVTKATVTNVKGDLNNDGIVDVTDILMEIKAYFNNVTVSTLPKGDLNGDKKIDLTDLLMILKIFHNKK